MQSPGRGVIIEPGAAYHHDDQKHNKAEDRRRHVMEEFGWDQIEGGKDITLIFRGLSIGSGILQERGDLECAGEVVGGQEAIRDQADHGGWILLEFGMEFYFIEIVLKDVCMRPSDGLQYFQVFIMFKVQVNGKMVEFINSKSILLNISVIELLTNDRSVNGIINHAEQRIISKPEVLAEHLISYKTLFWIFQLYQEMRKPVPLPGHPKACKRIGFFIKVGKEDIQCLIVDDVGKIDMFLFYFCIIWNWV